ncbi:MAG: glucose-6-phosphate isomerase [Endomicrobiaceae bacterium]|nr:glucose-6-phosphate isomerase [Endomicrobiaceae bacterium]
MSNRNLQRIIKKISDFLPAKKCVTVITALCFLFTSVLSQAVYGIGSPNTSLPLYLNDINSINNQLIPFNVGKITDALYSGKGKIVINIQDLHSHEQTQRNISTILSILDKKYGLEKVYVEGAVGPVETGWLSKIKNEQIKENILNNLLSSGRLTGSEYFAAEKGKENLLEGIENKQVYIENLKRLKEIYDKKTEIESYIPHIKNIIEKTAEKYYSKNNLKLNKIIQKNKNGEIRAEKYFEYLIDASRRSNIDLRKYGSIIEFIKLLEKQKELKREKINEEIGKLLNELKAKLTYAQYKKLTDKIGKKTQESEFYYELAKIVQKEGLLSYGEYNNAKIFFEYIILNQDLNPIELAKQEKSLLEELNYRFSMTESEKEIFFLKEYTEYMSGYLNNKLTAEEYEYFIKHLNDFKLLWAKYVDIDGIIDITKYFELFDSFYKDNVERNKYFIQNITGQMPKEAENGFRIKANINHKQKVLEELAENKQIIVVVTGGFHTYGFNKLLADEGINYVVVTPNITEETFTAEKKYENVFKEQESVLYQTLQKMLISQIGEGAVLNTDVLKGINDLSDPLKIEILNGMLSQVTKNENIKILNLSRTEDGFQVEISRKDKETTTLFIEDKDILNAGQEEITNYKETKVVFEGYEKIENLLRKIRENKRLNIRTNIDSDIQEIEKITERISNKAIQNQFLAKLNFIKQINKIKITKKFILMGGPGSGKGTLSQLLTDKYQTAQISSGNLLRQAAKTDPKIKATIESGDLVKDEDIIALILKEMERLESQGTESFIFDGFPRTSIQAEIMLKSFIEKGWKDDMVFVHLDVPLNIIQERLAGRLTCENKDCSASYNINNPEYAPKTLPNGEMVCPKCGSKVSVRADDTTAGIEKRWNIYNENITPLITIYQNNGFKIQTAVKASDAFNKISSDIDVPSELSFPFVAKVSKFVAKFFTKNDLSADILQAKMTAIFEVPLMLVLSPEKFVLMHYGNKKSETRKKVEKAVEMKDLEYLSKTGYSSRLEGTQTIMNKTKESFLDAFKNIIVLSAGFISLSFLLGFINPAFFLGIIPSVVISVGIPLFTKAVPVNINEHLAYNKAQNLKATPALLSLKNKYKVTINGQEYFTEAVSEANALNNAIFKAANGNRLEMYLLRENASIKVELSKEQDTFYAKKTEKYVKRSMKMKHGEYLFTVIIPGINDNPELQEYQTVYAHSPRQAVFAAILRIFYDVKNGFLSNGQYENISIDGKNESNVREIATKILDSYKGADLGKLIKYHKLIMRPSRTNKPVDFSLKQKKGTNSYKVIIPGLNDGSDLSDYQKVYAFNEESAVREAVLNLIAAKNRGELEGGWYNNTAVNRENLTDIVSYILSDKNFIAEKQKESYKQIGLFETDGFDSIAPKMEIEGIWNKIQNKWWVKLLEQRNKKVNSQYRKYLSRNLAVSIAEMPRTINVEKFINDHINPEEVRDAALELNTVTSKQFSKTASIAWKVSLAGILGIFLTAATGGLALAASITITSISALAPFIAAVKKNIEWHYNYNNMQDKKAISEISAVLSDLHYNSDNSREAYNKLKQIINETEGIKLSDDYLPSYILMIDKNYEISQKIEKSDDILLKDAWNKINIVVASRYMSRLNMNWGYKYKNEQDRQSIEKIAEILNGFKEKIDSYIDNNKDKNLEQLKYAAENMRYSIIRMIDDGIIFENGKLFEEIAKQWSVGNNDYNEIIQEMYKNVAQTIEERSAQEINTIKIMDSIDELLGKEYPELVSQTKADIKRMIEEDAFLSSEEKSLNEQEKQKIVEGKIGELLQQLEVYLRGNITETISGKSVSFGTAGFRGIIGEVFDFDGVALIAQSMSNIINSDSSLPKAVFFGNDTRFLGKWYSLVMERVFTANGIKVYTTSDKKGVVATPSISCYLKEAMPGKFAASLNITASHNPKEYNGVKPNMGDGAPALPAFTKQITEEIQNIQKQIKAGSKEAVKIAKKENTVTLSDLDIKHFEYLIKKLDSLIGIKRESFAADKAKNIGIIVDGKHTALMPVLKELLGYYGFTNVEIFNETRDVAFDKYPPEPNESNTKELKGKVLAGKSKFKGKTVFGIATDPDGDRFCIYDSDGSFISPNEVGLIAADQLLSNLISEMKAKKAKGELSAEEINKNRAVIVKSLVTTFELNLLAEYYSKEFLEVAFGQDEQAKAEYIKKNGNPIRIDTVSVGWKNIADAQKKIESSGERYLMGVESSGGLSVGLYDKDGGLATMMPVLIAAQQDKSFRELLRDARKRTKYASMFKETAVKFPKEVEAEIEKVAGDIIEIKETGSEEDNDETLDITSKMSPSDKRKYIVDSMAKVELAGKDSQWQENAETEEKVKEIAASRQKALMDWIQKTNEEELSELLKNLGMPEKLKVIGIKILPNEGIQILIGDNRYKEGDTIKNLLTFRASGTEPLVRVYAETTDESLTNALSAIGENIVKGAFKQISPNAIGSFTALHAYNAIDKYIKSKLQSIKQLFSQDAQKDSSDKRGNKFSRKIDIGNGESLIFDFSRTNMDEKLLSLFINLFKARNVKNKIEDMFSGKKINWTEGRAVLHTALRNTSDSPVFVEGTDKNVMDDINAVLQKMKSFSDKLISGEWKGVTGKTITDVVSIGIGGSDLGPRMATDALSIYKKGPNVHFVSNVDPNDINSTLSALNPETTLFIIESKTFTTEETLSNANLAKKWITSKLGSNPDVISKHFVAVSTNQTKVADFGIDTDNMFEFWDWVGGRYSVWSAVGLPLMCSVGYDNFMEFLDGAHQIDNNFRNESYENNIPVIMAMLNILERNFLERSSYAILPYNKYLKMFTAHIQQVYMESLGKSVDSKGDRINYSTGSEIYGTAGTDAQHSYLQEHHQGTDIIPVDFVGFLSNDIDDKDMQISHRRLLANMLAQANAMAFGRTYEETVKKLIAEGNDEAAAKRKAKDQIFDGNRPSTIVMFDKLTPRSLGALISLYENMVAALGIVWDINTFDQMGVELGKVNAKGLFNALNGEQFETDSSTQNLIDAVLNQSMKLNLPFVRGLLKIIAKPLALMLFYRDYKYNTLRYITKKWTMEAAIAAVIEAPLMICLTSEFFVLLHYPFRHVGHGLGQQYRYLVKVTDAIKAQTLHAFLDKLKKSAIILSPISAIAFTASALTGILNPMLFLITGIGAPLAISVFAALVENIKNHIIYNVNNNDLRLNIADSQLKYKEDKKIIKSSEKTFKDVPPLFKKAVTNSVESLQRMILSIVFKDNIEYTIVSKADDIARIKRAEILSNSGVKVNLVLLGDTNLVKETTSRLTTDSKKLAFGLTGKVNDRLTVFGYEKIQGQDISDQEALIAVLRYLNSNTDFSVKILDLTSQIENVSIADVEELSKQMFTSIGVDKPAITLLADALKQKLKQTSNMFIKPSVVASNITAAQIDSYGQEDIAKAEEQGITTIILSVDDNVLKDKSQKIQQILQAAHMKGLKVMFNYTINIEQEGLDGVIKWAKQVNNKLEPFRQDGGIDGIKIDLSKNGELATSFQIISLLTNLANFVNEQNVGSFLAVKMPSEIPASEYSKEFSENNIKLVVDYNADFNKQNISSLKSEDIIIDITTGENGIINQSKLANIFENNKVLMISFDSSILNAMQSNGDFSFKEMTIGKLITSIFETTPEGQTIKGINNGRAFVANRDIQISETQTAELYEMYAKKDINVEKVNALLSSSFKQNMSANELEGTVRGVLEAIELNGLQVKDIVFNNGEYMNLLMKSLVDYRLSGNKDASFKFNEKINVEDVLHPDIFKDGNKQKITEIYSILNSSYKDKYDTVINILSSLNENSSLTVEERTAVLDALLLMLLVYARQENLKLATKNIDSIVNMKAILSAA